MKLGTIFEDSALGLNKWLPAIWLIANSKNGISSHELGRALGVTQKSTWFMLHRIRLAMQTGSFEFSDQVEADETYIGGKARNMNAKTRARSSVGSGKVGKTAVLGMIERGGQVRAEVIPDTKKAHAPEARQGRGAARLSCFTKVAGFRARLTWWSDRG